MDCVAALGCVSVVWGVSVEAVGDRGVSVEAVGDIGVSVVACDRGVDVVAFGFGVVGAFSAVGVRAM
jgi:hypothetical protein